MMAMPKVVVVRPASRWAALGRAARRAWLMHQITGARMAIVTTHRLNKNDQEVLDRYPDMANKITPDMDARYLDLQALANRLTQLQVQLIKLDAEL